MASNSVQRAMRSEDASRDGDQTERQQSDVKPKHEAEGSFRITRRARMKPAVQQ